MTNQTIPKRSEVPEEMTWNLKDMFASDEAWMTEYEAMKAFPAKIAAFQGTLARSAGDVLAWFRLQDEIELRLSVLMGYASCKGDEDTGNSFYQDVRGKAMNMYVSIASAAAFATPEIMAIPEEALEGFYKAAPGLERYRRYLNNESRSWRPIAAACTRSAAAGTTFSLLPRSACWPPPVKWPTLLRTLPAFSATPTRSSRTSPTARAASIP